MSMCDINLMPTVDVNLMLTVDDTQSFIFNLQVLYAVDGQLTSTVDIILISLQLFLSTELFDVAY